MIHISLLKARLHGFSSPNPLDETDGLNTRAQIADSGRIIRNQIEADQRRFRLPLHSVPPFIRHWYALRMKRNCVTAFVEIIAEIVVNYKFDYCRGRFTVKM